MVSVSNGMSKFITYMTKPDSKAPIIALEASVVAGRTIQAYKRGGLDESRERVLEELTGTITWLYGVELLNKLGDWAINKALNTKGQSFDVGTDKVLRTPFENFMKKMSGIKLSKTQVAMLKSANLKGEWCIVIDGSKNNTQNTISVADINELDIPPKQKAKLLAKLTGKSVKEIYAQLNG